LKSNNLFDLTLTRRSTSTHNYRDLCVASEYELRRVSAHWDVA